MKCRIVIAGVWMLILLSLSACEEDSGPLEAGEMGCLSERWGKTLGDHVHGRARACGEDVLLQSGEKRSIEISAGESDHSHVVMMSGGNAKRIFDDEQVILHTVQGRFETHVHDVVFNQRPVSGPRGAPRGD